MDVSQKDIHQLPGTGRLTKVEAEDQPGEIFREHSPAPPLGREIPHCA